MPIRRGRTIIISETGLLLVALMFGGCIDGIAGPIRIGAVGDPDALLVALRAEGVASAVIQCPPRRTDCVLHVSDGGEDAAKAALKLIQGRPLKVPNNDRLTELSIRLKAGKISELERDELLVLLIQRLLGPIPERNPGKTKQ